VRDVYSERLLNLDTWIVRTLLLAPLVSVLTGSHRITGEPSVQCYLFFTLMQTFGVA